jgi:hypothetical protein
MFFQKKKDTSHKHKQKLGKNITTNWGKSGNSTDKRAINSHKKIRNVRNNI